MASKQSTEKIRIASSLEKNHQFFQERLDLNTNYDIVRRQFKVGNRYINLYFVNSLSDEMMMASIFRQISLVQGPLSNVGSFQALLDQGLNNMQVEVTDNMDEAIDQLLSGLLVIFGDAWKKALIIDVRQYPGREPEEPDTERVVRGSRDGFVENIIANSGLIRRRIRDERLRMEMLKVGERSKTDICLSYIQDIVNPSLVQEIRSLLDQINVDGIPMADKVIEEFVVKQGYNPFPKVRFTERPDVAAAHLYEGHLLLLVDTSPSIMILPTTYFHHVQHAEEFRQTPFLGIYIRWARFAGILFSLFLLPLWTLYAMYPDLLPPDLDFIGVEGNDYKIPIFLQFLIAELGLALLRMASIHTADPLATAMGLIAAVLIGEIAIEVGLFVPEVLLYLSAAAIGMYATPSYELGLANKLFRVLSLVVVYAFKVPGLVILFTLFVIHLTMLNSVKTPYLWPLIPFNLKAFLSVVLRFTSSMNKTRPSIVHPQDKKNSLSTRSKRPGKR